MLKLLSVTLILFSNIIFAKDNRYIPKVAKKDYRLAKKIIDSLKDNRINKKLLRKVRRNKTLNGYHEVLSKVYKVERTDNEYLNVCKNVDDLKSSYFNNFLIKSCFNKILSNISSKKLSIGTLTPAIKYYLVNNQRKLISSIKKLDRNQLSYISGLISKIITENNISPSQSLLESIVINQNIVNYTQNNLYKRSNERNYFNREFNRLISDIKTSINEDDNILDVKIHDTFRFYKSNKYYLNQNNVYKKLLRISSKLDKRKKFLKSKTILDFMKETLSSKYQNDILFETLWIYLNRNDFEGAYNYISDNNSIKNFRNMNNKLKFWTAYIADQNGDSKLAKHLFKQIISDNIVNYYSIVSLNYLKERYGEINLDQQKHLKKSNNNVHKILTVQEATYKKLMNRIALWIKVENESLVIEELDLAINNLSNIFVVKQNDKSLYKKYLLENVASIINNEKEFLLSFKLLHKFINYQNLKPNYEIALKMFPKAYINKIKKIDNDIDPLLVLSLIRQESAFNPRAVSRVGAQGLMQIMPATAKEINKNVKRHHLVDPSTNIKLGTTYLKGLLKRYNGNIILALAAYNAGTGRIKRWKKGTLNFKNPLLLVESIPFEETQQYVKLIYRNLFFYKLMNDKKTRNIASLEDTFKVPIKH